MARFTAAFPSVCRRLRPRPEKASRSAPPPRPAHRTRCAESCPGPGWFDSSWELHCGLDVHEGLPDDAKLTEWIEVALRSTAAC